MDKLDRRTFIKRVGIPMIGVYGGLLTSSAFNLGCKNNIKEKPNIILIVTDDQGYGDLGCHGNTIIKTPNLDKFASESTEFTSFYTAPVCAPTRASILTGRYNYRTGVIHTSRGGAKMHGEEITLAEMLSHNGYTTGIFGKWHLGDNYPMRAIDQGFQESLIHTSGGLCQAPDLPNSYFNPKLWHNGKPIHKNGYCTDIFTDAAIQFIKSNSNQPFFVYLSTNTPHTPWIVGEEYSKPYNKIRLDPELSKLYGMMTNLDDNVGNLLKALKSFDLEKNTIVIFMSDNGGEGKRYNLELRDQKQSVFEGGIRVPLYIRWPEKIKASHKINNIAAHIDLFPTLLDLCNVDPPKGVIIDGVSLAPLFNGLSVRLPERNLFFQFHRGMIPNRYQNCAVRSQKYKLVSVNRMVNELGAEQPMLEPKFELYDMENDPGERNNISEVKPKIVETMHRKYDEWFDMMRQSREFQPGIIQIGSEHENPIHLCRYQDSHYVNGIPTGWPVKIIKAGNYEISINRCGYMGEAQLFLKIKDYYEKHNLEAGTNKAIFDLTETSGLLDIWFVEKGKERIIFKENNTIGDVEIRKL